MSAPSPLLILTNTLHHGGAEQYVVSVSARIASQGAQVVVAATPGAMVERLDPMVRFVPVPLADVRYTLPRALLELRKLISQLRPQLILANSLATAWVARLASLPRHIPIVAVAHGWGPDRYPIISRPLAIADRIVPVSADVAQHLLSNGLSATHMRIVPNGINLEPFLRLAEPSPETARKREEIRTRLGLRPECIVAICVARFTEVKRQENLIKALKILRPSYPRLQLLLVGHGVREQALRDLTKQLEVDDAVHFLIKRDDVPDLLFASDLFVSASRWEGMPLSIIEAMASGLPIVATDVEGVRDLLGDEAGIRVALGDPPALAAAIGKVLDDTALRDTLGRKARTRAIQQFSDTIMVERLVGVMEEACQTSPPR